jgi:DNA-binding MarR family transcriptional regulator
MGGPVKNVRGPVSGSKLSLDDHLPFLVNRAGSLVIQLFSRDLAGLGLTVPMWRVLVVLDNLGEQRAVDLSILTSIEASTLSRLISGMEKKGLVARRAASDNRREVCISIAPRARKALAQVVPAALEFERELTADLPREDLAATKRTLNAVYNRLLVRAGREYPTR